jgi:hypothetical protein
MFDRAFPLFRIALGLGIAVGLFAPAVSMAQTTISSEKTAGSCSFHNFLKLTDTNLTNGGLDKDGFIAVVINDRPPVYAQSTGGTPLIAKSDLRFRTPVRIRQVAGEEGGVALRPTRVRVEDIGTQNEIGWLNAADLLCGDKPLIDDKGIERRAYIRTAEAKADTIATVTAYPLSKGDQCDGLCTELGTFYLYFVMEEQDERLLLSENYQRGTGEGIVGWIDKTDPVTKVSPVIPWPSGIGLRPREDLVRTKPDGVKEEGTICAFPDRQQALAYKTKGEVNGCRPILGGPEWFALPLRMALLGTEDGIHQVVVHAVGTGQGHDPKKAALVDPKKTLAGAQRNETLEKTIRKLKAADIFFLVDGTDSMKNTLDAIKGKPNQPGVVDNIVERLRKEVLIGARLRYGFRIYGDTSRHPNNPYGTTGIGEGYPFDGACESDGAPSGNYEAFKEKFNRVRVRDVVSAEALEDYAENVYGGIEQALTDIAACRERVKLLFVIGDNGYNASKQTERGFRPHNISELIKAARERFGDSLFVFFVQPPRDPDIGGKSDYQRAYKLFTDQAEEFLRQFYRGQSFDPRNGLIAMERNGRVTVAYEQLAKELTGSVTPAVNPEAVETFAINVRSGKSVRGAVANVKTAYPTVPGWFWDLVSSETCQALGAQCDTDMFQAVPIFYIADIPYGETAPDVVSEIWLPQEQLSNWVGYLAGFADRERGDEARKRMVLNLLKGIEETTKIPFRETTETFQNFFARTGYFKGALETPLMRYSPDDLKNPDVVKPCEFERLRHWALRSRELLQLVQTPGQQPKFKIENSSSGCPLSKNGLKIPFLPDPPQIVPLAPGVPGAAFGYHSTRGGTVYWIPQEFMP